MSSSCHPRPSFSVLPLQDIGMDPRRPDTRVYGTSLAQPWHTDSSDIVGAWQDGALGHTCKRSVTDSRRALPRTCLQSRCATQWPSAAGGLSSLACLPRLLTTECCCAWLCPISARDAHQCCRAAVPEDCQGGRRVQLVFQRGGA
jgi:hypothetical protein